ncbi:MAG: hypothetical protein FJW96_16410, partial [Actinobacteria bacterium]|nr:hypothetical protein [Actinomycetota bacterium]
MRLRGLLRLRGRDRRPHATPLRRRARPASGTRRGRRGDDVSVSILNASGCLDALAAPHVARTLDAFVTKTITPEPREGNPVPRIAETEHGMLNSIGLQGPGIDAFCEHNLPALLALGVPIWVSVGGFSASDYASICAR